MRTAAVTALVVGASLGCSRRNPAAQGRATRPLPAEISGCSAVVRGRVCEISAPAHALRIWIPGAHADRVAVSVDGQQLSSRVVDVDGGQRAHVEVPTHTAGRSLPEDRTTTLTVLVERSGEPFELRVPLRLAASSPALLRAQQLRKEGLFAEARSALPDPESLPAALRGRVESVRARIDLASGDVDGAVAALRRAQADHRRHERWSDETLDAMALAHTLLTHGSRLSEASRALDEATEAVAHWDEGRVRMHYYRALVARDSGDVRLAARELEATTLGAARLGLEDLTAAAGQVSARLAQARGDIEGARRELGALDAALPATASACERARSKTNAAWVDLMALEEASGVSTGAPDPEPLLHRLEDALALWEQGCPTPVEIANARANIALGALWARHLALAAHHARRARSTGALPASVAAWLVDIEARIALAQREPRTALALYDDLAARAKAAHAAEPLFRAYVGRGLASEALGDTIRAERAYRNAEAVLDESRASIAVHEGLAAFLAARGRSARLLADLLVVTGRADAALVVVRKARLRALGAVQRLDRIEALAGDERSRWQEAMGRYGAARARIDGAAADDWTSSADRLALARAALDAGERDARRALDDAVLLLGEPPPAERALRAPRAGELLVAFQETDEGELRVFAATSSSTTARAIRPSPKDGDGRDLGARIVASLGDEVENAKTIRFLTYGSVANVDFHAVPWRGAPLLAHAAVEYAVDLPLDDELRAPESFRDATRARRHALVVADTREDLPEARREGEATARSLAARYETSTLVGAQAERSAVLEELARSESFHFAGHATYGKAHALDGVLELAAGGALRVADILVLPRAPTEVVLSGCNTGRAPLQSVVDLNLAHAFVAKGSRVVVAAVRPVKDVFALSLMGEVYEGAATSGAGLAQSLRTAQVARAEQSAGEDWAAYRVVTR